MPERHIPVSASTQAGADYWNALYRHEQVDALIQFDLESTTGHNPNHPQVCQVEVTF